jgi:glycosyltransferase involved in cell wall biosynthesis
VGASRVRPYTILHTIQTGGPGGAETVVLRLATQLDPERFRSVALVPEGTWLPQQLRDAGVPTRICPSSALYDLTTLRGLVRVVREEGVDLIHSHLPQQNFHATLAGLITRRPVVACFHGAVEIELARGWLERLRLAIPRRFSRAVVVVCDQMAGVLTEAGFAAERIVRIYNGVELPTPDPAAAASLRSELGLETGAPLVGMVANIRAPKGHEYLIRAARKVVDRFPMARFLAAGEAHPLLSPSLEALVRELGLEREFLFLGFRDDVDRILNALDVSVLPSISEGFPFVTLESMALARPTVSTRCGGPEEIVEDGKTGYLVPVADPQALADRILELLGDPERSVAMGAAARRKIERAFSLRSMTDRYEELYERLCRPGQAGELEGLDIRSRAKSMT